MSHSPPTTSKAAKDAEEAEDAKGENVPTTRINFELLRFQINTYFELNYPKLLPLEKAKFKILKQKSTSPDNDDEEEVRRIAKEIAEKYGKVYGRSTAINLDIGMGYDDTDSFTDDSEPYDEVVPEEDAPLEGGFYMRNGPLPSIDLVYEAVTTKTDEIIEISSSSESHKVPSIEVSEVSSSKSSSECTSDESMQSLPTITSTSNPSKENDSTESENDKKDKTKKVKINTPPSASASSSTKIVAADIAPDTTITNEIIEISSSSTDNDGDSAKESSIEGVSPKLSQCTSDERVKSLPKTTTATSHTFTKTASTESDSDQENKRKKARTKSPPFSSASCSKKITAADRASDAIKANEFIEISSSNVENKDDSGKGPSMEAIKPKSSEHPSYKNVKSLPTTTTSNPLKKKASTESVKRKKVQHPASSSTKISAADIHKKKERKNKPVCGELQPQPYVEGGDGKKDTETEDQGDDIDIHSKKAKKVVSVMDAIKSKRDEYFKSQIMSASGELKPQPYVKDNEMDTDSDEKKQPFRNEEPGTSEKKLSDLEPHVLSSVNDFINSAKPPIGKKFQFNDDLIKQFLKMDENLLRSNRTSRADVFAKLENILSLSKYYFSRKSKQLRTEQENLKIKMALDKLRNVVNDIMPLVRESYDAERRKYNEKRCDHLFYCSTTCDSEPAPTTPKKKFPWNIKIRNLLYDVYQTRKDSYHLLCTHKESLQEFITSFIHKEILNIWPEGWMDYEELEKEIKNHKAAVEKAEHKSKSPSATVTSE